MDEVLPERSPGSGGAWGDPGTNCLPSQRGCDAGAPGGATLTWDEAQLIADEIEESIAGDAEPQRLRDTLVSRAVRYARIRTDC